MAQFFVGSLKREEAMKRRMTSNSMSSLPSDDIVAMISKDDNVISFQSSDHNHSSAMVSRASGGLSSLSRAATVPSSAQLTVVTSPSCLVLSTACSSMPPVMASA